MKAEALQKIRETGVIAVVRAASADEALKLANAIAAGGLPILEITMTVPDAVQVIAALAKGTAGKAVVGAGSVLDAATAAKCIEAGARFVVTPALQPEVIAYCRAQAVAVMAGALTPTEVVQAWTAGADLVKVFPAGAMGGPGYIKSLKGPLPQVELVPTGGVTLANAAAFIEAGASAIGVGSELANVKALRRGRLGDISRSARAYVEAVRAARPRASPPS